ncbi:g8891 [Coccomyxa viridis]|uniref:G8891 protein n=1 Tax=Coccomyxa viridis TaxID=1274662 RepID=A0ABP1G1J4_9CHLO
MPGLVPAHLDGLCQWDRDRTVVSTDLIFWIGDLNYRLNMPDVLARRAGHFFSDWHEGPLNFRPTYKFRQGTDTYVGSQNCAHLSSPQHVGTLRTESNILAAPSATATPASASDIAGLTKRERQPGQIGCCGIYACCAAAV